MSVSEQQEARGAVGGATLRTVVLRHEMPDGSSHLDWMLERASADDRRLVTFRVRERVDQDGVQRFEAERIRDHRAAYLEQEGEVPGGRGVVKRLSAGRLRWLRCDGEQIRVAVDYGGGECVWTGRTGEGSGGRGGGVWLFQREM